MSEFFKELEEEQLRDTKLNLDRAQNPDQSAKIYNLSERTGFPPDYVERNTDEVQSQVDYGDLSPILADFLRERKNAEVSRDDLDNLNWWETAGREAKNVGKIGQAAAFTASGGLYSAAGSLFDLASDVTTAPFTPFMSPEEIKEQDLFGAAGRFFGGIGQSEIAKGQTALPKPGETYVPAPVISGIQSFFTNLTALGAGLATRNPNTALAIMGTQTYGTSYAQAKEAGASNYNAFTFALSDGLAEVVTERMPAFRLFDDLAKNTGLVKTVLAQMAMEIPSEQVATLWQDANAWASLNPEKTLAEFASERPDAAIDTLISTIVATGLQTASISGINKLTQERSQLDSMAEKARESKVLKRSPDVFAQHLQNIAEEYGQADIYLNAEEVGKLLNQEALEDGPEIDLIRDQLAEAQAVGGDIVIPIEQAGPLLASKNYESLKPLMRLSPESTQEADAAAIIAEANKNVDLKTRADEIYAEVEQQLIDTGRLGKVSAKASATIIPAYVTTKAVRTGMTVDEVYQMMGLSIVGPQTELKGQAILDQLVEKVPEEYKERVLNQSYTQEDLNFFQSQGLITDEEAANLVRDENARRTGQGIPGEQRSEAVAVYRGSAQPLKSEDFGALGAATGHPSAALGVFFTSNQEDAARYGAVAEHQLTLENPKTFSLEEDIPAFNTPEEYTQFRKELQSQGHDGIVFDYSSVDGPTHYVAFDQASVDGKELFQGEDKNLYVAHNLSESNLKHALELGGLSAPSLAIKNIDKGSFDAFGEITLLADPSIIQSPKARTFDADVYTTRHPRAVYSIDRKAYDDFIDVIQSDSMLDTPDAEEISQRGMDELINSPGLQHHWLKSNGVTIKTKLKKIDPALKKIANSDIERWALPKNKKLISAITRIETKRINDLESQLEGKKLPDRYRDAIFKEDGSVKESVIHEHILEILSYRASKGIDTRALGEAVSKKFRSKKTSVEFEKYVVDVFNDLVTSKKIFKGYTYSGNRKYIDYNLDNIVKEMTKKIQGGEGFNYGPGSVRAAFAHEMKTIKQVQKRRGQIVTKEEFDKVREESSDKLMKAVDDLRSYYKFESSGFGYIDDATNAIAEGVKGWNEAFNLDEDSRKIITDLVDYLRVLPTEYFETKIGRAVELSEFSAAIVPNEASKETIEALKDNGLKVIKYSKGKRDEAVKKAGQRQDLLFQDEQKGPRGKILLLPDESIIQLTEASNLSTFLHESGHLFLEMEQRFYDNPNVSREAKVDGDEILKWLGVESFDDIKTEHHEKFARGFERYLGEGKAPSIGLQSAFRRFAAWLKQVYRDLTRLNVELTPEIREVMDRMLATDAEIDRIKGNFTPLFESAEDAGMTEAEYFAYNGKSTPESAKEALQARMVKQLERTYKKWWKDESVVVAEGIKKKLLENPLYSATETLKTNPDLKLTKAKVRAELGKVTPKFKGMTAEQGTDSDDLAAMFGFASGNELIHIIEESPTLNQQVKILTEAEMVKRHGDILNDGTIAEEAEIAIRNPERARKLITELNAIARKNKTTAIDREALKAYAQETIAKLPFSKIRPAQYRSAEIRAAKQSVEAKNKGDFSAAQKAKTQELINFYLSREATQVREKSLRIRASLKAIKTRKYDSKKYNNEVVNEAKVLISAFDFRKSNRESVELAQARLKGTRIWIESQRADPDIYLVEAEILGKLIPWNDMTSEDLRGLNDVVTSIVKAAKLDNVEAFKANMKEGQEWLKENRIDTYVTEVDTDTPWVKAKRISHELFASLRKMESLVRQADGMNDQGWLWRQTIKPLLDASNVALEMRTGAHAHLNEMFEGYNNAFNGLKDKRTFTLDSGRKISMSYGARVSLALNMGNAGNLEALLNQEKLLPEDQPLMTENDLNKIVATLADKDWDLVQNVWDYVDTYWADISALEIRRSGVAPVKIQALPFVTPSGRQMKGGYYPLVADPSDPKQQERQEIDTQHSDFIAGGAAKLSTKHGSTIERVGFGGSKVDLSINVLFNHVDGVIHDLTHWEPVRDVAQVLKSRRIKSELVTSLGLAGESAISDRLKEVASGPQKINGLRGVERFLRHARLAATYSALGYSVRTSLMNMLGLTTGIAELDTRSVAAASIEYYSNISGMNKLIDSKSKYMPNRHLVINRDIAQIRQHLKGNTAFNAIKNHAFTMMTWTDRAITRPVWLAAYHQGETLFNTDQEAIDHADRVVARTQGSGLDLDLANVETRSELMKTMTVMFSAMSAIYNISVEQVKRSKAGKISKANLALRMGWLIVIPGIIEMLISGGDDPEKEPGERALSAGASVAYYGLGLFPLIREGASYAKYGSSFPTPAAQLATYPLEAMGLIYDAASPEEEVTKKEFMRFLSSTAGAFHVPGGRQFERTAGYLIDLQDNEIDEFSPYGLIVTGKE